MAKLQIFLPDGSEIRHELSEESTMVGRLPENGLSIEDESISSQHAEISFHNGAFYVRDLGSTNGTYVNGEKTEGSVLENGDEIRFGSVACAFSNDHAVAADTGAPAATDMERPAASHRPPGFVSCSPLALNERSKDPGRAILAVCALAGIAAFVAGLLLIFQPAS